MSRLKQAKKKKWFKRHLNDPFVKQARQDGFRSRAAYKLLAVQQRDQLIRPSMLVVDLGAAPGGWSQVVSRCLNGQGEVFAVDVLPMEAISGVRVIHGDFSDQSMTDQLLKLIDGRLIDAVLSDMAPNLSGNRVVDQAKSMYLCDIAKDFALNVLKPQGSFLIKTFQGSGFQEYRMSLRQSFKSVVTRNVRASRASSRECYLLAKGKKG